MPTVLGGPRPWVEEGLMSFGSSMDRGWDRAERLADMRRRRKQQLDDAARLREEQEADLRAQFEIKRAGEGITPQPGALKGTWAEGLATAQQPEKPAFEMEPPKPPPPAPEMVPWAAGLPPEVLPAGATGDVNEAMLAKMREEEFRAAQGRYDTARAAYEAMPPPDPIPSALESYAGEMRRRQGRTEKIEDVGVYGKGVDIPFSPTQQQDRLAAAQDIQQGVGLGVPAAAGQRFIGLGAAPPPPPPPRGVTPYDEFLETGRNKRARWNAAARAAAKQEELRKWSEGKEIEISGTVTDDLHARLQMHEQKRRDAQAVLDDPRQARMLQHQNPERFAELQEQAAGGPLIYRIGQDEYRLSPETFEEVKYAAIRNEIQRLRSEREGGLLRSMSRTPQEGDFEDFRAGGQLRAGAVRRTVELLRGQFQGVDDAVLVERAIDLLEGRR